MSEPSKAAISKACELLGYPPVCFHTQSQKHSINAFALFIDKVSEAASEVDAYFEMTALGQRHPTREANAELMLPSPPDQAVLALSEMGWGVGGDNEGFIKAFRAALANRGLKIVEAD